MDIFADLNHFFPANPYYWSASGLNNMIADFGQAVMWRKNFLCPCTGISGSPDPHCKTCFGRGTAWEAEQGPFQCSFGQNYPVESGGRVNEKMGFLFQGAPWILVPTNASPMWEEISILDQVIQLNALTTYNVRLNVGTNETLPYTYNASVAPTGAVRVYDLTTNESKAVPYTLSGSTVTITGYPPETPYTVQYQADAAYVLYEEGGQGHIRPITPDALSIPKRFQTRRLDLWLRDAAPPQV